MLYNAERQDRIYSNTMDEGYSLHADIACSCAFSTTQALYCHGVHAEVVCFLVYVLL